jgi:hypothetical protein
MRSGYFRAGWPGQKYVLVITLRSADSQCSLVRLDRRLDCVALESLIKLVSLDGRGDLTQAVIGSNFQNVDQGIFPISTELHWPASRGRRRKPE